MTTTAKELIKKLKKLDPNEVIYAHWFSKSDVISDVINSDFTDENDDLYSEEFIKEIVSDQFVADLSNSIGDSDYFWDNFSDIYNDTIRNLFGEYLKETQKEIVNKEIEQLDQELWN